MSIKTPFKMVPLAVIWELHPATQTKTITEIRVLKSDEEEVRLPGENYDVSYFWDNPDTFSLKVGQTVKAAFDPYDWE